ncbi:hypothetical protein CCB80_10230 [Armatimonadetes bacterium Uphvl-Ar1]|nr:hypothetical protein CCB80_10230 [Armatimonadetes bacterium Uphvl-Ar1]
MSASVLYTNFGGMLVHEDRGGVERTYVHDEMGNTRYLLDSSNVTDTYSYTPYGQVTHAGTNVTPFTFIGALGYFATGWSHLTSYVRARWYSRVSGSWGSIDPLWPWQKAYQYVDGNPAMYVDPDGKIRSKFDLWDLVFSCGGGIAGAITGLVAGGGGNSSLGRYLCEIKHGCLASIVGWFIQTIFAAAITPILAACLGGMVAGILAEVMSWYCDSQSGCQKIPNVCDYIKLVGQALGGCLSGIIGSALGDIGLKIEALLRELMVTAGIAGSDIC